MMFWYGPGMGAWGMALMVVSSVVVWVLLIGGAVTLYRHLTGHSPADVVDDRSPEEILSFRYAHGEIGEDEYRHRLGVIARRDGPPADRP